MIHVIWEFEVPAEQRQRFELAYVSDGVWAKLFRRDPAYCETVLIRDHEAAGRYLTVDVWQDESSYRAFKEKFAEEYHAIDRECEALTQSERLIGIFERL
jgi:quinol monooxygenase YgiN